MVQVAQLNPGEIGIVLGEMPWGALSVMEVIVSGQCEQQGVRIDSSLLAVGSAAVQGYCFKDAMSLIRNQLCPFQMVFTV